MGKIGLLIKKNFKYFEDFLNYLRNQHAGFIKSEKYRFFSLMRDFKKRKLMKELFFSLRNKIA